MDFQFFGANCTRITTKKAVIVVDDTLQSVGGKSVIKAGDIALYTQTHDTPGADPRIVIDQPGEYEVANISIQGIPARSHMDESDTQHGATIFKIVADDIRVAVIGHVFPQLSNEQLEQLGTIDVLIVPTGGNGYTLDPVGALKLIKEIEPKIVIPTHYGDDSLSLPVPQQPLQDVIKTLAIEAADPVVKLKVKTGELSDGMKLVVLERS